MSFQTYYFIDSPHIQQNFWRYLFIMDRLKELFHTKTPKEMMQENKRAIRGARRELEREKNRLVNEKTRNENEIRKLAAKGEQVYSSYYDIFIRLYSLIIRKRYEHMQKILLVNAIKSIS